MTTTQTVEAFNAKNKITMKNIVTGELTHYIIKNKRVRFINSEFVLMEINSDMEEIGSRAFNLTTNDIVSKYQVSKFKPAPIVTWAREQFDEAYNSFVVDTNNKYKKPAQFIIANGNNRAFCSFLNKLYKEKYDKHLTRVFFAYYEAFVKLNLI